MKPSAVLHLKVIVSSSSVRSMPCSLSLKPSISMVCWWKPLRARTTRQVNYFVFIDAWSRYLSISQNIFKEDNIIILQIILCLLYFSETMFTSVFLNLNNIFKQSGKPKHPLLYYMVRGNCYIYLHANELICELFDFNYCKVILYLDTIQQHIFRFINSF